MTSKKRCVAMILAGGQGNRLKVLTRSRAKPAVPFGGKYRIIDFTLSNCAASGINTVGVLTQYEPLELNSYIGTGAAWDLDSINGGAYVLPPYVGGGNAGRWYSGTADAIYQNLPFIDRYDPKYLLVLSGDHIYRMNYRRMIRYHRDNDAAATVAVLHVPIESASRFGVVITDEQGRIKDFEEKPEKPKSDLVSMGIYVFDADKIREYLKRDAADANSSNDFGKNVLPAMLAAGERMFAYNFSGYWKDVGTIDSLWEANMELLDGSGVNLWMPGTKVRSRSVDLPPHYAGADSVIRNSMIGEGCVIEGTVIHSVISPGVRIEAGAVVRDSVILKGAVIKRDSEVVKTIADEETVIGPNAHVGDGKAVAVIGRGAVIGEGTFIPGGDCIEPCARIDKEVK